MTSFDFFRTAELPIPSVTPAQAESIAREQFGLKASAAELGSNQDANFLLRNDSGEPIGVLKVANPAFSRIELEAQDAAAAFIASGEGLRTATNIAPDGTVPIAEIAGATVDSDRLFVRLIRFLPGGTLSGVGYLSPIHVAALGEVAARTCRALAGFEHPGVDRVLQWDLRHAMRTVELLACHVGDPRHREAVQSAAGAAWQVISGVAGDLPVQIIHGDVTGDNVVCGPDGLPDGVIDLGDLIRSWTVGELAVTVSGVLHHDGGEPSAAIPAITAFHEIRPLSSADKSV